MECPFCRYKSIDVDAHRYCPNCGRHVQHAIIRRSTIVDLVDDDTIVLRCTLTGNHLLPADPADVRRYFLKPSEGWVLEPAD